MRSTLFCFIAPLALTASLGAWPAAAAPGDNAGEEAALKKRADAFTAAFDKGDAKAVAAFWTEDGDYVDETGKQMKGRAEIEKAFTEFFAENKGVKVQIHTESLRFVTPDVAVEDGVTSVAEPDGAPPSRARYTVVHVKKDGQWMLSSVRDSPYAAPSNYEHLKDLEWVIGDWADEGDNGRVARISFEWSESQNFILGTFTASFKNIELSAGSQRIGWDPTKKEIRSWTFDEDGAFGHGAWSKDGDRWVVKTELTLPDGKKVTATNIITRADADTVTWQSKDRTVDGKPSPDVKEVKMKRVK
ncbi:MAG TPA: SgcJ/EcaC family oxidoreductase [Gemmataceae bacterium]|nr:SgcJ/EcaC family oxidoreductase [Gemmataceae bacterium]